MQETDLPYAVACIFLFFPTAVALHWCEKSGNNLVIKVSLKSQDSKSVFVFFVRGREVCFFAVFVDQPRLLWRALCMEKCDSNTERQIGAKTPINGTKRGMGSAIPIVVFALQHDVQI